VFYDDAESTGVLKVARNFMPPGQLALLPGDVIKEVVGDPGPDAGPGIATSPTGDISGNDRYGI
jgi:hypothetical protein